MGLTCFCNERIKIEPKIKRRGSCIIPKPTFMGDMSIQSITNSENPQNKE